MTSEEEAERYRQIARDIRELAKQMHRISLQERTFALADECERIANSVSQSRGEISN